MLHLASDGHHEDPQQVDVAILGELTDMIKRAMRESEMPGYSLGNILSYIAEKLGFHLQSPCVVIYPFDPLTSLFFHEPIVFDPRYGNKPMVRQQPRRHGGLAARIQRERLILVEDLAAHPELDSEYTLKRGIRSFIGMSLQAGLPPDAGDQSGVVYINFETPRKFTKFEVYLARIFADVAALTIHHFRLIEVNTSLGKIANHVSASEFSMDLVRRIYEYLHRYMDADGFLIARANEDGSMTLYGHENNEWATQDHVARGGYTGFVLKTGKSLLINSAEDNPHGIQSEEWCIGEEQVKMQAMLFEPLILGDRVIGVISVQKRTPPYTREQADLLAQFGHQIAGALEGSVRMEQVNRDLAARLEELDTMMQIARSLNSSVSVGDTLTEIQKASVKLTGAESANLTQVDASGMYLELRVPPYGEDWMGLHKLRIGREGITGNVAETLRPALVPDVLLDRRYATRISRTRSELAVPIISASGRLLGVLNNEHSEVGRFTLRQLDLLTALADQAAVAIERAELMQRETLAARRFKAFFEAALSLHSTRTMEETSALCLQVARDTVEATEGRIWLLNPVTQCLEIIVSLPTDMPDGPRVIQIGEGLVGQAARSREGLGLVDVATPPQNVTPMEWEYDMPTRIVEPIILDNTRVWGVIELAYKESRNYNDRADVDLVKGFARLIATSAGHLREKELARQRTWVVIDMEDLSSLRVDLISPQGRKTFERFDVDRAALERIAEDCRDVQDYLSSTDPVIRAKWSVKFRTAGTALYRLLFEETPAGKALSAAMVVAGSEKPILRIEGGLEALALPFEGLFDGNRPACLSMPIVHGVYLPGGTPIYKTLPFVALIEKLRLTSMPIRILLIASDGGTPIQADSEIQQLKQGFEHMLSRLGIDYEIQCMLSAEAGLLDMRSLLTEKGGFHIVHVAAHGRFNGDVPADSDVIFGSHYGLKPVTAAQFNHWLSGTETHLVFFNICLAAATVSGSYFGDFGNLVESVARANVPIVVGHRWTAPDSDADKLAVSFYRRLFETFQPHSALFEARCEVGNARGGSASSTWASLVLIDQNARP